MGELKVIIMMAWVALPVILVMVSYRLGDPWHGELEHLLFHSLYCFICALDGFTITREPSTKTNLKKQKQHNIEWKAQV